MQLREAGDTVSALDEMRAERDKYQKLFAWMIAEYVGVYDGTHHNIARISFATMLRDEDFVLVEWPMVEFSYDFSICRKADDPSAGVKGTLSHPMAAETQESPTRGSGADTP